MENKGYIDFYRLGSRSVSSKYIIIVVFVQSLPARDFRAVSGKSSVVKTDIQQSDFQSIVADQVD